MLLDYVIIVQYMGLSNMKSRTNNIINEIKEKLKPNRYKNFRRDPHKNYVYLLAHTQSKYAITINKRRRHAEIMSGKVARGASGNAPKLFSLSENFGGSK